VVGCVAVNVNIGWVSVLQLMLILGGCHCVTVNVNIGWVSLCCRE